MTKDFCQNGSNTMVISAVSRSPKQLQSTAEEGGGCTGNPKENKTEKSEVTTILSRLFPRCKMQITDKLKEMKRAKILM